MTMVSTLADDEGNRQTLINICRLWKIPQLMRAHHPVKTFDDYNLYLPPKGVKPGHIFDRFIPAKDIREKLDQVKGHLVWMPLDYLKDANMAETGLQVNSWTESVYT